MATPEVGDIALRWWDASMSSVIVHPDFGGGAHEPFDGEEAEVRCGGCMQKRVGNQSCRMIHARRSKVQRRGSLQLGGRGNAVEPTWRRAMQVHVQSHGGGGANSGCRG
jgi:hypothetical protein